MQEKEEEQELTLSDLERYQADLNTLYEANINLRMKYPTEPMRFYQTEEDIDTILQQLAEVSQEHLPLIVQSNILAPVLKLLNHPNEDINIACISFLHELVSEEPEKDTTFEVYYRMCVWLVDNGLYESLVATLSKLKQEESVEEYEVALQVLKIIETLTEQVDSSVELLVAETKLLEYLANRIMPNYVVGHKVIDDNKYVGSDVLAYLLSHSQQAQLVFHRLCGMEILVESIRPYLSRSPESSDEKEFLGNLFDCLNILLINPAEQLLESRLIFLKMKGNEMMLQFLKGKTEHSLSALKAIANSFTGLGPEVANRAAEEFIDFGGLKYLFPMVMRQGIKGKDIDEQMAIDESCMRVLLVLVVSTSELYKARVEAKLTQKRFAKLEKLFEVRSEYMQNMGKEALKEGGPEEYFQRLKDGLGVVEVIDQTLCYLIASGSTVRRKLVVLMRLYGVLAQEVEFVLKNKYKYIEQGPQKGQLERVLADYVPLLSKESQEGARQPQAEE